MDRQGDRRRHEDTWWRELYGDDGAAARDTGPADAARDSLDDRVDSAFRAVGQEPGAGSVPSAEAGGGTDGGTPAGPCPEPMALPAADPAALDDLVPDTELDGAGYATLTLRAASLRGEAARHRGEPRGDALLTARFGAGQHALLLAAVATAAPGGSYAYGGAHRAARDVCRWIGGAVGRSYTRLAEDIRTGSRDALRSGLHRLTDRSYGKLRAHADEHGMDPGQYTAALRCLLLPADPACRTRVFFGVGAGGFFRLSDGVWQDLEPPPPQEGATGGPAPGGGAGSEETLVDTSPWPVPGAPGPDALAPDVLDVPDVSHLSDVPDVPIAPDAGALLPDFGATVPGLPRAPSGRPWQPPYEPAPRTSPEPFRFRTVAARPGDLLLLCSAGLAGPLTEAAGFGSRLAARWTAAGPPGLAAFLADVRLRAEGYGQDRTAVAVWEAARPG
ncbi:protein phosphatase 2C domain-containing protein [Streptomyces albofaciens JCM 4342]|uniref:protein phosphatase 2C domain-containing protein n=1 Tax=Streptomyces albofaciens TaxID=66866 RepID=UPI00123C749C|nr:protein phosphatase 2C domain-containing protein [Streptomyces albofaciens JCM 4342]